MEGRNAIFGNGRKILVIKQQQSAARREKTDLKVFVVVIPKEGLAGWGPANPSLGMTPTIKLLFYCLHRLHSVFGVIPKEGLAWPLLRSVFS